MHSIDVVLPFFNRIVDTCRSVNSVLAQTHTNFRLILINDASTDDISPLLHLIDGDSRCIIVHHDQNLGCSHARNTGLNIVSSDYVAFLDSDDFWHPCKLETQLFYMLEYDLKMTYTPYFQLRPSSHQLKLINMPCYSTFPRIAFRCKIATPTVMVRSDILYLLNFPSFCSLGEDIIAWSNLSREFYLVSAPFATSFVSVGRTTSSQDISKQKCAFISINHFLFSDSFFLRFFHMLYFNFILFLKKLR